MTKVYEEMIDFIAAGTSPEGLIAFQPSAGARARALELLDRAKRSTLSGDENAELEHYLQLEHLMWLAKARARRHVAG